MNTNNHFNKRKTLCERSIINGFISGIAGKAMCRRMIFIAIFAIIQSTIVLGATYNLYYPIVAQGGSSWTGIAVANPNSSDATLNMMLYSPIGGQLASRTVLLGGHQQHAYYLEQLFGISTELTGWVQVTSDQQISGFAIFGSDKTQRIAGIQSTSISSIHIVLSHVAQGSGWQTTIAVCNIAGDYNKLGITAFNNEGNEVKTVSLSLAPKQQLLLSVKDLFLTESLVGGHLEVTSEKPVVAAEIFDNGNGVTGITGSTEAQPYYHSGQLDFLLNFPLAVSGPNQSTGIAISNSNPYSVLATIVFHDKSGQTISSVQRSLSGKSQQAFFLSELLGSNDPASGWVQILSNAPLTGFEIYGDANLNFFSGIEGDSLPAHNVYISHIAQGPGWRSILSVINYSPATSIVAGSIYGPDGALVKSSTFSISPFGQILDMFTGLFQIDTQMGGQIVFQSDTPILVSEFFDNGISQAGISGQMDYQDDSKAIVSLPIVEKPISANDGGTIQVSSGSDYFFGGMQIQVPPGALTQNLVLGVNLVPSFIGHMDLNQSLAQIPIEILPVNITFQRPVTITLPLTMNSVAHVLNGDFSILSVRRLDQRIGQWIPLTLDNIDSARGTITVETLDSGLFSIQATGPASGVSGSKRVSQSANDIETLGKVIDLSGYSQDVIDYLLPSFIHTGVGSKFLPVVPYIFGGLDALDKYDRRDYTGALLAASSPAISGLATADINAACDIVLPDPFCKFMAATLVLIYSVVGDQLNILLSDIIDTDITAKIPQQINWFVEYRKRGYLYSQLFAPTDPPSAPFCGAGWLRNPNKSQCTASDNVCLTPFIESDFPCGYGNPYNYIRDVPKAGELAFTLPGRLDRASLLAEKQKLNAKFKEEFDNYIISQQPRASFSITQSNYPIYGKVSVDATASVPSNITMFQWDFGDSLQGFTDSGKFATHTYRNAGTYPITLSITVPGTSQIFTATKWVSVSLPSQQVQILPANPTISVTPTSGPTGTIFTIIGSGFTQSSQVQIHILRSTGAEEINTFISSDSRGGFTYNYRPGSTNPGGPYKCWVTDIATGKDNDSGARISFTLLNTEQGPTINSVGPQLQVGLLGILTVLGNNFDADAQALILDSRGTEIVLVTATLITHKGSTELDVPVTINNAGDYLIRIQNPDGQFATWTFHVNASSMPGPRIDSISPSPVDPDTPVWLVVRGANFQAQFTATVIAGGIPYTISPSGLLFGNSSQVQVQVTMLHGSASYTADLKITNPDHQYAVKSFTVGPLRAGLQPSISFISPNLVTATQATTLTVNGSNFQSGFSASVTSPAGTFPLTAAALTFISSSQVQAQVTMNQLATMPYTATLTITNPGGASASGSFQVATSGSQTLIAAFSMTANGQTVSSPNSLTTTVGSAGVVTVSFDASASHDPFGRSLRYSWTSGTDLLGVGSSITKPFAIGSYTITLTVTNDAGLTGSTSSTLQVQQQQVGQVQVVATLNGNPWIGSLNVNITGPNGQVGRTSVPTTLNDVIPGTYSVVYLGGGPNAATFASVLPSASQTLVAGQTITFTLNFTRQIGAFTLTATPQCNSTTSQILLQWTLADNATAYRLFINGSVRAVAGTSYTDPAVTAGIPYTYFVTANDDYGTTRDSNTVTVTALSCSPLNFDLFGPAPPAYASSPLNFTSIIYGGKSPFTFVWGSPASGSGSINVTTFPSAGPSTTLTLAAGTYTISLTITDANNQSATRQVTVDVVNKPPSTVTIHVLGTFNAQPWSGSVNYTITGRDTGYTISGTSIAPAPDGTVFTAAPPDQYSLNYLSGGPATPQPVTPQTASPSNPIIWFSFDFYTLFPDLEMYNFDGAWDGPVVVSTQPGNHTLSPVVQVNKDLYLDFAVRNYPFQTSAVTSPFDCVLTIDGVVVNTWTVPPPFIPGQIFSREDYVIRFTSTGRHRVQVTADPAMKIPERNRDNNTAFVDLTVVP